MLKVHVIIIRKNCVFADNWDVPINRYRIFWETAAV